MIRVVADDKIPFLKGVLEPFARVEYLSPDQMNRETLKNADALLVRTRTRCDEKLLEGTRVKFIATATIGFDHIDTGYCERAGIRWFNAPGCNSASVMQYIAAALVSLAGEDRKPLAGRTIGIVGVGNVGSKVVRLARLLGMNVLLNDPPRERSEGSEKFVSLEKLLKESDIITLHVPLSMTGANKTFHLINSETISLIKPGAWFINTSRGEVAETAALKALASSEDCAGMILDVWENEPRIDLELLNQTVIGTSHIAGYSLDGKANGTAMVVRNFAEFFGIPPAGWYPENLEGPANPEIVIECLNISPEKVIGDAILHTHDILQDDRRLRREPQRFEIFRDTYPVRREFPAYHLRLKNPDPETTHALKALGFQIF
jgi:erythronate-4-phosphate dehydrogenase